MENNFINDNETIIYSANCNISSISSFIQPRIPIEIKFFQNFNFINANRKQDMQIKRNPKKYTTFFASTFLPLAQFIKASSNSKI